MFDAAYVACLSVSAVLCSGSLWWLCARRRQLRRRLFWIQLVALSTAQSWFSVFNLVFRLLYVQNVIQHIEGNCHLFWVVRAFLEYLTSIIEVHIAAGFAAACFRSLRAGKMLLYSLPVVLLLPLLFTYITKPDLNSQASPEGCTYRKTDSSIWAVILICFCMLAVLFYCSSVVKTAWTPSSMRRRAQYRGLSYLMNFVITFGFRAGYEFSPSRLDGFYVHSPFLDSLTMDLIASSGALFVITYMLWIWHARVLQDFSGVGALPLPQLEDLMINRYFDLDVCGESDALDLDAQVALQVAGLRDEMSRQESQSSSAAS